MPRRRPSQEDAKAAALRAAGALHSHPEAVQDEAFVRHEFLDRRDRVQVKYEMVRRHRVEGYRLRYLRRGTHPPLTAMAFVRGLWLSLGAPWPSAPHPPPAAPAATRSRLSLQGPLGSLRPRLDPPNIGRVAQPPADLTSPIPTACPTPVPEARSRNG